MLTLMYWCFFFANHDLNAPIYAPNIHLAANHDINSPLSDDGVDAPYGLLNTQTSMVGEGINFDTSDNQ